MRDINTFRAKLISDMEKVFGADQKRIDHAITVLKYAEQIQKAENGDPLVVTAAAILHDIGIHEAERKYGSSAGKYQEIEGPAIAKEILSNNELDDPRIDHICKIIANHHSAKDIDTTEFRIIWDADWLVNIPDEHSKADQEKLQILINKVFRTCRGHQIAEELFISKQKRKAGP